MRVQYGVGLTRGLTADDIADRQEACAFLAGFLHGRQRIGRFSRLADSDDQALGVMIGSRYRNSEALSTSTGTRASDSIINLPTCAACSDVPIPTICRRSTPAKKSA